MRSDAYGKKKTKTIVIVVIVAIAVLVAAGAIGIKLKATKTPAKKEVKKVEYLNPLTGEAVKKDSLPGRPVMVSTDNDCADSRPQAGLTDADIVYEVPVEGGASRYEQIFFSKFTEKAGPTRSVRPYIVDVAREYKAVLVHNGWSPQAREYLQGDVIPYYPAIYHDDMFWRVSERYIPHNQFTNVQKDWDEHIVKDGNDEKQDVRTFKWIKDGDEAAGSAVSTFHLKYPTEDNLYEYDAENNVYKRFVDGSECVDENNGKQVTISNVLVQMVSSSMYDEKRLNIDMTQGGDAYLFTGGKMVKGTWSREDLDSPTIFKDKDGKEFKMTPGKTWIQLMNQDCTIDAPKDKSADDSKDKNADE